jgi:hypothetical protein
MGDIERELRERLAEWPVDERGVGVEFFERAGDWLDLLAEIDSLRQQHRVAVEALHEAIRLARDFNRGAMTWQEYDRKLAALEVAHPT